MDGFEHGSASFSCVVESLGRLVALLFSHLVLVWYIDLLFCFSKIFFVLQKQKGDIGTTKGGRTPLQIQFPNPVSSKATTSNTVGFGGPSFSYCSCLPLFGVLVW
jgi:hypothetical protein